MISVTVPVGSRQVGSSVSENVDPLRIRHRTVCGVFTPEWWEKQIIKKKSIGRVTVLQMDTTG